MREAEATRAERIIETELDRFQKWLASLEVVPTITALREHGDEVVRRVTWRRTRTAGRTSARPTGRGWRLMAKAIASRILHEPTRRIRRAAGPDDAYQYVSALRELFGLDVETEVESEADAAGKVTELRRPAQGAGPAHRHQRGSALALTQPGWSPRCSAAPSWSRSPPTGSRATSRASCARSSRRVLDGARRHRRALGEGPAGRGGRGPGDRRGAAARGPGRRLDRRRDLARGRAGGRPGRDRQPAPEGAAAGGAAGPRILDLNGNVDTRLRKLAEGDYDAIILAAAGLRRLGREDEIGFRVPDGPMVPAAGQGALAVQVRTGDEETAAAVRAIGDAAASPSCAPSAPASPASTPTARPRSASTPRSTGSACGSAPSSASPTAASGSATSSTPTPPTPRRPATNWRSASSAPAPPSSSPAAGAPHERPRRGRVPRRRGPGDPGLMTARSLELIADADVDLLRPADPAGALDGAARTPS